MKSAFDGLRRDKVGMRKSEKKNSKRNSTYDELSRIEVGRHISEKGERRQALQQTTSKVHNFDFIDFLLNI